MKTPLLHKSFLFLILMGLSVAQGAYADAWLTDIEAAQKQAATDKKNLLIVFTTPVGCPDCSKLAKRVFDQADFQTEAAKDFVLLKINFPKDQRLWKPEAMVLMQKHAASTFPTTVITDPDGHSLGQSTYVAGMDAATYNGHLKVLVSDAAAAKKAFADAGAASDDATKIKNFIQGIEALTDNKVPISALRAEIRAVAALDKAKTQMFGGRVSYQDLYIGATAGEASIFAMEGRIGDAHQIVDQLLNDPEVTLTGEQKQSVLYGLKAQLYLIEGDAAKAIATYKEAIKMAPGTKLVPRIEAAIKELEEAVKKTQSDIIRVD